MRDVERRYDAAYWYAVGRCDGERFDPDMVEAFADFAKAQAIDYYDGHGTFLASVGDQWQQFLTMLDDLKEL